MITIETSVESKANVWLTSFHSVIDSSLQDVSQLTPGDLQASRTEFTAHGPRSFAISDFIPAGI